MSTYYPPTPSMVAVQFTHSGRVLRRTKTGETPLRTPTFEWKQTVRMPVGLYPRSGNLRMAIPGMTAVASHQLFCQYAKDRDGGLVIRPRDIFVTDGDDQAFRVEFVADEGGAHVYLTADVTFGVLNQLQHILEQG